MTSSDVIVFLGAGTVRVSDWPHRLDAEAFSPNIGSKGEKCDYMKSCRYCGGRGGGGGLVPMKIFMKIIM